MERVRGYLPHLHHLPQGRVLHAFIPSVWGAHISRAPSRGACRGSVFACSPWLSRKLQDSALAAYGARISHAPRAEARASARVTFHAVLDCPGYLHCQRLLRMGRAYLTRTEPWRSPRLGSLCPAVLDWPGHNLTLLVIESVPLNVSSVGIRRIS